MRAFIELLIGIEKLLEDILQLLDFRWRNKHYERFYCCRGWVNHNGDMIFAESLLTSP